MGRQTCRLFPIHRKVDFRLSDYKRRLCRNTAVAAQPLILHPRCPSIRHTGATIGGIGFSVGGVVRTGRRGGRGGAGIPANPKELKGGSANDGVPSLSLISIFGFLSVNPSSVAAMPAIRLLPYIAIGDRGEARTVTTHCSRTMRSLRRHMGGMVIVVVSATAFFGRTCKHCCRGQHGYHD